jgi:hypothetical protein
LSSRERSISAIGSAEVFAEVTEYAGNNANDRGIATSNLERSTSKIQGLAAICARVVFPTSVMAGLTAKGS